MLFNSVSFALFLPVVFFLYWFVARKNLRSQNFLLLVASYFFYSCWDYRFLLLLAFSTLLDYFTGLKIYRSQSHRNKKLWLISSIIINIGLLGFFKYYNFFVDSFGSMLQHIGLQTSTWTLNIILPIGISFYTFHGLSYVIDIYHDRIKPEPDLVNYSVFVSFFPLLVAGPIERATHLLPQIKRSRTFDYGKAVDGCKQILWGLVKKMVIADNCAEYVNSLFAEAHQLNGSTLFMAAILFAFQIYGDFSGYSDIAIGTAKLFNIDLLKNFSYPYFSRSIAEFWRRWHISLSSWFRDYVYIPLGGSRASVWIRIRNTVAVFLISGLWHGANWTFVIWGLLNALLMLPHVILPEKNRPSRIVAEGKLLPSSKEILSVLFTFCLTTLAWVFFRSENLEQATNIFAKIFSLSFFEFPSVIPKKVFALIFLFMTIEWMGRKHDFAIAALGRRWSRPLRWATYLLILESVFLFAGYHQQFIYFEF